MKKSIKIATSSLLLGCMCLAPVGCVKPTDNIVNDGKTVNVRVFEAGYGTEWLYALKDKFEAAYATEGYKINILEPSNSVQTTVVINELYNGGNGVDLYFPGSVWVTQVTEEGEFGKNLVEDLTELVYSQPAIGFDGKEEGTVTVREKMKTGIADDYCVYYNGREFGFPWNDGASGLAVNMNRLDMFGYDLPRTTDEMLTIFDSIMLGKDADGNDVGKPSQTGIYPHTFVSGNSGYPGMMYYNWVAQYMGYEKWQELTSYEKKDDPNYYKEKGYELYADQSILEMLKVMYQMFDTAYATKGSTSQTADAANYKMIDPDFGAVFFSNGNWMINEVKGKYPEEAKALRMINYPVISALGTKVFGAGTTANITDAKKCDKVLSETIRLVDENKTNAEIVTALQGGEYNVTTTEKDIAQVREARLMYNNRVYGSAAYITKDSPVKDIAALFLRMYASNDNAELYYEKVGTNTVFDHVKEREGGYQFSKDVIAFANREGAISINGLMATGLRKKANHASSLLFKDAYIAVKVTSGNTTKWVLQGGKDYAIDGTKDNSVYHAAAKAAFDSNAKYAQDNWATWMASVK